MSILQKKMLQLFLIIFMVVNGMENTKPVPHRLIKIEEPDDAPTIGINADTKQISSEAILDGRVDDRVPLLAFENVEELKSKWSTPQTPSESVCLLRIRINGVLYTGSGIKVLKRFISGKKSKTFIYTAAHCLVNKKEDEEGTDVYAEGIDAYFGCISLYKRNYIAKIPCTAFHIHPEYLSTNTFISNCHDIGVIEIPDEYQNIKTAPDGVGFHYLGKHDLLQHINHETIQGQISVVGYPGEKGGCWDGRGSLVKSSQNSKSGLFHYNVNTTGGQSGGAVFLYPPFTEEMNEIIAKWKKVSKSKKKNPTALLIGIHRAGGTVHNSAVKLSAEIMAWDAYKSFWDGNYLHDEE